MAPDRIARPDALGFTIESFLRGVGHPYAPPYEGAGPIHMALANLVDWTFNAGWPVVTWPTSPEFAPRAITLVRVGPSAKNLERSVLAVDPSGVGAAVLVPSRASRTICFR